MIKKSYFIKIYNLVQMLGTVFVGSVVFLILFKVIQKYGNGANNTSTLPLFQIISITFKKIVASLELFSLITPCLILVLLLPEITQRLKNDSLFNLGKSYIGTFHFKRFLKQSQEIPRISNHLDEKPQKKNRTILQFNQAIRKSVLDVTQDQLKLYIKVPQGAQAQKILKEHEEQIKEHVASLYSDYIISTFERKKFSLWLIGTKRK